MIKHFFIKSLIVFFCINYTTLLANNEFSLSQLHQAKNITPYLFFAVDEEANLSLSSALSKEFKPLQKSNFGITKSAIWTKVTIFNDTNTHKHILLLNPAAGVDEVDVWLLKNGAEIGHFTLGDMRSIDIRPIKNRCSTAPVEIASEERVEFVARSFNAHGATGVEWVIKTPEEFMNFLEKESLFWGVLVGVILALIVYSLTLFVALREKIYAYYILFAISSLLYQLSVNGILHSFGIWLDMGFGSVYGCLSLVFVLLFGLVFFPIKRDFPIFTKIVYGFIFINLFTIALLILSLPSDILATKITIWVAYSSMVVVFLLSCVALYAKYRASGFFFAGQTSLVLANLLLMYVSAGFGDTNFISTYAVSMGTFADLVLLSIAIGYNIKQIETQRKNNEILLSIQNRFTVMGKVAGNISHQWRQPISHLGTLVMLFDSIIRKGTDETARR